LKLTLSRPHQSGQRIQRGALDLLLPRLLTGEPLDQNIVRGLAVGGLLLGPSRIAPYHTPHQAAK